MKVSSALAPTRAAHRLRVAPGRQRFVLAAASLLGFAAATLPAAAQTTRAPSAAQASPPAVQPSAPAKPTGGRAHVYVLRGLMNIFSLGMDDLAEKIRRRGVAASVHNHAEAEALVNAIAAKYKAGKHGPVILIGHSLGANAVMLMGQDLDKRGIPVALIVPFDGTESYSASKNVARVVNITQRDYAHMKRGAGFRGTLSNVDVSKDGSITHTSIDKSARLHAQVIPYVLQAAGGGARRQKKTPDMAGL